MFFVSIALKNMTIIEKMLSLRRHRNSMKPPVSVTLIAKRAQSKSNNNFLKINDDLRRSPFNGERGSTLLCYSRCMTQTHLDNIDDLSDVTHLAFKRNIYAFERTALAYFRTSITFLIASITIAKLFTSILAQIAGILLIPMSVYLFILGLLKYRELTRFLQSK